MITGPNTNQACHLHTTPAFIYLLSLQHRNSPLGKAARWAVLVVRNIEGMCGARMSNKQKFHVDIQGRALSISDENCWSTVSILCCFSRRCASGQHTRRHSPIFRLLWCASHDSVNNSMTSTDVHLNDLNSMDTVLE